MTTSPDGVYKWIGHVVDHFAKFHVLFPMVCKEASEVAKNLTNNVLAYFGLPYILHSDKGKEFVNNIIRNLAKEWPGECKLINRKARSPLVQGLVERTNACVEEMIAVKQQDYGCNNWSSWLPDIQCKILLYFLLF